MIRPVNSAATTEPASRTGFQVVRRSEGHGDRASNDAVEQQGVAVQQVAVVAFGNGVYGATVGDSVALEGVHARAAAHATTAALRPSVPPSSASAESLTEAAIRAELAAAEADAESSAAVPVRRHYPEAAGPDSLSFDDFAEQIAAKSFITHAARPVQGDPEATLQKLLRMRDDALDPPASVADLAIATAAAIHIGRLVRDRYAAEQIAAATPHADVTRPTLPAADFKA